MPRKPKVVEPKPPPKRISIHDELGQEWHVDAEDDLWEDVRKLTNDGSIDAILPLSTIFEKRGWGWWSCFKTQDEWLRGIGVPVPNHDTLSDVAGKSAADLTPLLQKFGGYVAFLETQVGLLAGRRNALKNAYDAAVLVHTAQIEEKASEKSKEAQVLASSETLKQTKRLYIETDMLYETARGMCEGYVKAYEAVSRVVSVRLAEMELAPRGRA